MDETTENNDKIYIVKTKHNNSFYGDGAKYTADLYEAKLYCKNEIPESISKNPNHEIINLHSEEGLEIILSEFHKTERYISIKSKSLGELISGLYKIQDILSKNNNKV